MGFTLIIIIIIILFLLLFAPCTEVQHLSYFTFLVFATGKALNKGGKADVENGSNATPDKSKDSKHQGEECKLLIQVC